MGRYRNVSILGAAIFLQVLGLAIQVKRSTDNQSSRLIRIWAVSAITPFEKALVRVQTTSSDIWRSYFYLRGVRQENRELRDQIEQLRLEQVRLKQDADQAHRLQALLGFKEQFIAKTTAAQVIGSSGSEQSRIVYIDKGSRDGIQPDMAVISADGVVGKVITVFKGTSQVLLINDQQSGVGTILEQSRLQGVLKGKASGELTIDKIMTEEEVKPGDTVLTSGGDQIFPKGLRVGTIDKVSKGPEFLQVSVKPAAVLSHLEEVLVITRKEEREAQVSSAATTRAADILSQRLPSVPDAPTQPATASTNATKPAVSPANSPPSTSSPSASGPNAGKAHPATANGAVSKPPSGPLKASAPSGIPAAAASAGNGTQLINPAAPEANSVVKSPTPTSPRAAVKTAPSQAQTDPPADPPQ